MGTRPSVIQRRVAATLPYLVFGWESAEAIDEGAVVRIADAVIDGNGWRTNFNR